jgi:TPR repeat protein
MEFELVVFVVQGRRDEGIKWYKQAAELRHPAGMCNLGLAYLQGYLLFFTPQLR